MKARTIFAALGIAIFLLAAILAATFTGLFAGLHFSLFSDPEGQLKEVYNTYYSDFSSGSISELFETTGNSITSSDDSIMLSASFGAGNSPSLASKKVFDGQEVVVRVSAGGDASEGGYSVTGASLKCSQSGSGTDASLNCPAQNIIYRPHTSGSGYDVIQDGVVTGSFDAPDGFAPSFAARLNGGRRSFNVNIEFIGYRATYCEDRANEVWVQEAFSSPFGIDDLKYEPTQFCALARPFTIREVGKGEAPIYPNPIPAFNRGQVIGQNLEPNQVIYVNYLVPFERCQASGCRSCGIGEANVWQNGQFACASYLRNDEPRVIEETEIIVAGRNVFELHSPAFSIGDLQFASRQAFGCPLEDGSIMRPPNPSPECYKALLTHGSTAAWLTHSQDFAIDGNLRGKMLMAGDYTTSRNDLTARYVFTADKTITLRINGVDDNLLVLEAINHLPTNDVVFVVKQNAARAELNLPEHTETVRLPRGPSIVSIAFSIEDLGINTLTVQSFYPVGSQKVEGDSLVFGFEIIEKTGERVVVTETETVIVEKTVVEKVFISEPGLFRRLLAWLKSLFS